MNHVPYKGGAPAIADVMGGQVPCIFANIAEATLRPYKSGKIKVLATSGLKKKSPIYRKSQRLPNLDILGFIPLRGMVLPASSRYYPQK
jgi:tripartite-type tricarboxylate transporter receptor subunit TctC